MMYMSVEWDIESRHCSQVHKYERRPTTRDPPASPLVKVKKKNSHFIYLDERKVTPFDRGYFDLKNQAKPWPRQNPQIIEAHLSSKESNHTKSNESYK